MIIKFAKPIAVILLSIPTLIAIGVLFGQSKQKVEPPRVRPLVQQLGDDKFATRQAATRELHEIGEPAIPALLEAASSSDDAEIRWRARQLVRSIMMFSKTTGIELVVVEAGEFQMGSPEDEKNRRPDETQHKVLITKPFLLGKYEVTQQEYEQVMKINPSSFTKDSIAAARRAGQEPSRFPVEQVSWFDAIEYCNKLSELDKLTPYYKLSDVDRAGTTIRSATVSLRGGAGYRLPTEAEWEYACRAGSKSRFHFGEANSGREANVKPEMSTGGYGGASPRWRDYARPAEVGAFPTNAWGFAEMHGNVAEWCWDWYDKDFYAASDQKDPTGPDSGTSRVQRGGSWLLQEDHARSASRAYQTPDERKNFAGFRIARTPDMTPELQRHLTTKLNQ